MKTFKNNQWVFLLLLGIIISSFVAYLGYRHLKKQIEDQTRRYTTLHLSLQSVNIDTYLNSLKGELETLSHSARVRSFLQSVGEYSKDEGNITRIRDYFLKGNSQIDPDYLELHNEFDKWSRACIDHHKFHDLFLIDNRGNVVYTVVKEDDFATNLEGGPYTSTGLGKVYRKVLKSPNDIVFEDFSLYAPSDNKLSAFTAARVQDVNGKFLGSLVIQLPVEDFVNELSDVETVSSLKTFIETSSYIIGDELEAMDKPEWSDKFDTHHFELFTNDHLINGNWRLMAVLPKADLTASLNYRVVVNWGLISFFSFSIMGLLLMLVLHHFFSKKEISPSDILLVQSSWHNISDQADQVAERFYKELFMLAPQLRQLFRSDVQEQKKSLSIMLNYIVNGIDRIDDLKKTSLIPLAKRHVGYGVQDEHFKLVIQAIINSVAHSSGGSFSQKHYQAWYKVLRHISDVMIREMDSG